MPSPPATAPDPQFVKLPRSSTRLQKDCAHLKLLKSVKDIGGGLVWDGTVLRPGAMFATSDLPPYPVILECAGPIGTGRNREWLWILWRLDRSIWEWREIARSQGLDNSATWTLREAALAAMNPAPELYDVSKRARELADKAVRAIDETVQSAAHPVRVRALNTIYDMVAGRIASLLA